LAGGSSAGKFIEEGYRRARKYKGSFLTGTQGISDYLRTPAALAALENSDWIFLLRGKEESITALEQKIALSPSMKSKIRSLNTEAGQYSDIFVYSPVGYGVGRLVSDPFNALLSSSKGEDFEAIRHKQREGLTISQAVETVLKERGIHVH
jgi:conjugal transfer ATP-binding protein TraC